MIKEASDLVGSPTSVAWTGLRCSVSKFSSTTLLLTLWMCMGHIFKGLWRDTLEQQTKNSERLGFGRVLSISIHLVVHSANFLIVPACHLVLRWEGCGPVPHIDYRQEGWLIMEVFHQRPCNIWKKSAVGLTNRKTCFGSWDLISLVLNLTKS
jgi:hypothetical protein